MAENSFSTHTSTHHLLCEIYKHAEIETLTFRGIMTGPKVSQRTSFVSHDRIIEVETLYTMYATDTARVECRYHASKSKVIVTGKRA